MFSGVVSVAGAPELLAQVGSAGDDASSRLTLVIVGLLVLAVLIAIVTVVFWRMTRPPPADEVPAMHWTDRPEDAEAGDRAEHSRAEG